MDKFFSELGEWVECFLGGFALVLLACSLLLLDTGCSYIEGGSGRYTMPDGWCESHFCMDEAVVFTPAGEGLYDITKDALARFSVATGRELTTDPQAGIPVLWREDIVGDGVNDCGTTIAKGFVGIGIWTQAIYLDPTPPPGCPAPAVTLLHELIHAMAPEAEHVDVDSLFAPSTGLYMRPIDEPALERLCETFDCQAFNPER